MVDGGLGGSGENYIYEYSAVSMKYNYIYDYIHIIFQVTGNRRTSLQQEQRKFITVSDSKMLKAKDVFI